MNNYDVVTVGAATLDIFMRSDKFKVMSSDAVPGGVAMCEVYGGKMEVDEVTIASGGGATNIAVSMARKDLRTACICEMGNDPQALIVHQELEEAFVDTRYVVQEPDETTAVSVILIAHDGGRSIMVHRGASAMLTKRDLPWEEIETRWMHISSLGGNIDLLKDILSWAQKKKVRVSFNPGMKEIKHGEELVKLLPKVEVLFLNREESDTLLHGREAEAGVKAVIVTAGSKGGEYYIDGKKHVYEGKKYRNVVDTTGAGDAFASGYVAALLYGHNYERAISWGIENAGSILKAVGAKKGLLTLSEIKNF